MKDENMKKMIERVIKKDHEAFMALYECTNAYVYKCLQNLGVRYCDHEDIVQMVFIDVYEKVYQLQDYNCFFKWLFMVTRSNAYRFIRKFYNAQTEGLYESSKVYEIEEIHSPTVALDIVIRREVITSLLKDVSDSHAKVLSLRYLQELSMDEIAAQCKIPLGTAKSRLHQAKLRLQALPDSQKYQLYL